MQVECWEVRGPHPVTATMLLPVPAFKHISSLLIQSLHLWFGVGVSAGKHRILLRRLHNFNENMIWLLSFSLWGTKSNMSKMSDEGDWETADGKQQVWQDEIFRVWQNLLHMQKLPLNERDKIYRGQTMENICFDKSSNVFSFTSRLRMQSRQMSLFVGKWQIWQSRYK